MRGRQTVNVFLDQFHSSMERKNAATVATPPKPSWSRELCYIIILAYIYTQSHTHTHTALDLLAVARCARRPATVQRHR